MKMMFITNNPQVAKKAEEAGVRRIFVDLEKTGKAERQGHLDTHITTHTIKDIKPIKKVLSTAEVLVRINPYSKNTPKEIEEVISSGADVIMLPMFENKKEVEKFIEDVDGRAKTCLLLETPQAFTRIKEIIQVPGINEIHVGLNDLSLGLGLDFMFEILSEGLLDYLTDIFKQYNIVFGFGGIARVGEGALPAELVIKEHARLGSRLVILSRGFVKEREEIRSLEKVNLKLEVQKINIAYEEALNRDISSIENDRKKVVKVVREIACGQASQKLSF